MHRNHIIVAVIIIKIAGSDICWSSSFLTLVQTQDTHAECSRFRKALASAEAEAENLKKDLAAAEQVLHNVCKSKLTPGPSTSIHAKVCLEVASIRYLKQRQQSFVRTCRRVAETRMPRLGVCRTRSWRLPRRTANSPAHTAGSLWPKPTPQPLLIARRRTC